MKQTFTAGQVLEASDMATLQQNDYNWTVDTKTDSYVLVAGDAGKRIVMNAATAKTITVNTSIFTAGDTVWIHNIGAGTCTVTAGTCTVNTAGSLALAQWEGGSLYFTSASSAIFFRGGSALGATQVVTFTTTGSNTWNVPSNVDYVVAHMIGGGGGTGQGATAGGTGGTSQVAFAAGTITALGGSPMSTTDTSSTTVATNKTGANYGDPAITSKYGSVVTILQANRGAYVRAGGAVTPGGTLTVTVGAGGTAGTNGSAGKQGIVWLEYVPGSKRRIDIFKAGGTWTPPTGVTSAVAYVKGGGGGCGFGDGGGSDGGNSSVAFSSGTITGTGGSGQYYPRGTPAFVIRNCGGAANSGQPVIQSWGSTTNGQILAGLPAEFVMGYGTCTPGVGVTVTIGAGGAADLGASTGGSGLVIIEYNVP
jgi:hypothetical protein